MDDVATELFDSVELVELVVEEELAELELVELDVLVVDVPQLITAV